MVGLKARKLVIFASEALHRKGAAKSPCRRGSWSGIYKKS